MASGLIRRRRGDQSHLRRNPVEYVVCVLSITFSGFVFLYLQAFNDVLNHGRPKEPNNAVMDSMSNNPQNLVLRTKLGPIFIKLKEDLSKSSVEYIQEMVAAGECPRCVFYRAENGGILQGIMKNPAVLEKAKVVKGDCPEDLRDSKWKDNCHGPIMTHGMVGWAAGDTGPDFFVDWYKRPAKFWGAQHTVWGIIEDEQSAKVMEKIWEMPVTTRGGLAYLDEPIKFEISLERSNVL